MNPLLKISLLCLLIFSFCTGTVASCIAQTKNSQFLFDSTKAIKEIEQRNEIFLNALRTGDSIALGNFYTADAKIFNTGSPTTDGRDAIVKFYGRSIRAGINNCAIITTGVWGSDNNLVVEEGTIDFLLSNGKTAAKGRYLLVWKRENGVLRIFRDSFSSDSR
jgi:ketosteroid isomerase-like protein